MTSPPLKVLYIAGNGRCGSTLLERLTSAAPNAVSVGELRHLVTGSVNGHSRCGCGDSVGGCSFWAETLGILAADGLVDLSQSGRQYPSSANARRLRSIYVAVSERAGNATIVDSSKSPEYLRLVQLAADDVKVLRLHRDPRGIAASWKSTSSNPLWSGYPPSWKSVHDCVSQVRRRERILDIVCRSIDTIHVDYERLCLQPSQVMSEIFAFADLRGSFSALIDRGQAGTVCLPITHSASGNPRRFEDRTTDLALDERFRHILTRWERAYCLIAAPSLVLRSWRARNAFGRCQMSSLNCLEDSHE